MAKKQKGPSFNISKGDLNFSVRHMQEFCHKIEIEIIVKEWMLFAFSAVTVNTEKADSIFEGNNV